MKIRLEGTHPEIVELVTHWGVNGLPTMDNKTRRVKSISKPYPNRVNSTDLLNGVANTKIVRVYVELFDN